MVVRKINVSILRSISVLVVLKVAFGILFSPSIFIVDSIIEKLFHMLNFIGFYLGLEYSLQDYRHTCHSGKSYLAFQELFSYL